MSSWIRPIETQDVEDGKEYFLGRNVAAEGVAPLYYFHATDIKGKKIMSQKPGIARRFAGGEELRKFLIDHPELKAVPVPGDAEKRWNRRKRRM